MPYDVYGPNAGMSFYDKALAYSNDSALNLFKTYSIHPPDDASGSKFARGKDIATLAMPGFRNIRHARIHRRKVARLHLTRGEASQGGANEGGDALYGSASYLDASPGLPVYWLPWDSGGAIVELAIPAVGTRGAGHADPSIFFTAAINGCSVFISGTQQAPTVHHAGGDTGVDGPAEQAKFWRDLMTGLGHAGVAEINKEDYIRNSKVPDLYSKLGGKTTRAAMKYRTWLDSRDVTEIEIESVNPWGAVMGLRDGAGNWKFYLQENASVSYYTLRKKKRAFKSSVVVREQEQSLVSGNLAGVVIDRKRTLARPMRVSEIFPNRVIPARIDYLSLRYKTA